MGEITTRIWENITNFTKTVQYGSLNELIICFALAAIIASVMTVYYKNYLGKLVRELIALDCIDEDSAKSLKDLKFTQYKGIRKVLKKNSTFRRIVTVIDTDNEGNPIDLCDAKLYVAEGEAKDRAIHTFVTKGNNIKTVLLTTVISIVMAAICIICIPYIIQLMINAKDVYF